MQFFWQAFLPANQTNLLYFLRQGLSVNFESTPCKFVSHSEEFGKFSCHLASSHPKCELSFVLYVHAVGHPPVIHLVAIWVNWDSVPVFEQPIMYL